MPGAQHTLSAAVLFACLSPAAFAQTAAARPQFEVASVKAAPTESGLPPGFSMTPRRSGERISWTATAGLMIFYAWHLQSFQVSGNLLDGFYSVDAKMEGAPSDDQVRLMFQSLLEDRFGLKVHRETKELPVYALTRGKSAAKLKEWKEGEPPLIVIGKTVPEGFIGNYGALRAPRLVGHKASMSALATTLSQQLKSVVTDQTGLTGDFDFELSWTKDDERPDGRPTAQPVEPGPTIFMAVQSDLGLKLEKSKGPVEILVIDHLQQPSAN